MSCHAIVIYIYIYDIYTYLHISTHIYTYLHIYTYILIFIVIGFFAPGRCGTTEYTKDNSLENPKGFAFGLNAPL